MQIRGGRVARIRGVLRALLVAGTSTAAALTATALAPAASAESTSATTGVTAAPVVDREGHLRPGRQLGTRSGSGGARSGDFTVDEIADILARDARNGQLKVYPHSGAYQGTATFRPSVTINHGWGGFRWIGQGDLTGDKLGDVVYVDSGGVMRVAAHSGSFSGTGTLVAAQAIGTGWNINDLIFTYDYNADGFDDVFARRAGTGHTYIYFNNGGLSGTGTLQAPQLLLSGPVGADVDQSMGDFTGDGAPDMLLVQTNGVLGLFDFEAGQAYTLGWGWEAINAITVIDVNRDGRPDVLGRRKSDGALLSYAHSGTWAPAPDRTAYGTLRSPLVIGTGWHINNVIT